MAHVGSGAAEEEDCFEDAYDRIPAASQMDLHTAIQETQCALNLVLNDKFSEALDLLKPWWKDSMYHALGYSSILVMQATMTFEHRDIQAAMSTIKEALQTCQRFRKKNSVVGSLSSLISKQSKLQEEEMHAEICYAECLLQKATLTFVQDENMISFIKGGIKIRTSYQIYKDCQNLLNVNRDLAGQSDAFRQFEGGVKLGIGSFNLMLSLLPQRVLRLLEFIGFSGNRGFGLSQLREGASSHSLRSILCALTLLFYNTFFLGGGGCFVVRGPTQRLHLWCRQVEGLKQRLAGKSIPTEKFAVRKSRRYKAAVPVLLVVPALEMMYVWNGFSIVGKRADSTEALLVTIETAEEQLRSDPSPSEFHPDDSCLVQMLKGLCLKHLGRLLQAELCFTQVLSSETRIRYDHYLIPFTLYELGLLYKLQGDFAKAATCIENAKTNYKDYSMESRLHFRIHAALSSLRGSPVGTP
ncbi:tetratricopeptide repeat protein 39B isoform X2 [Gasterosteus aculeatus]